MKIRMSVFALAGLTAVSACELGPKAFETEPVRLPTAQGYVYCQLYTRNSVTWDHSIAHPNTMDVKEADRLCFEEGYRLALDR